MIRTRADWITVGELRQKLDAFADRMETNISGVRFEWAADGCGCLVFTANQPEQAEPPPTPDR